MQAYYYYMNIVHRLIAYRSAYLWIIFIFLCRTIAPKSYIVISLKVAKHQCERVNFLEHVQAKITLTTQRRGDIQIHLTSPAGTKVTLLTSR